MSDAIGSPSTTRTSSRVETVREAYSFACMSCGYSWEQAYDIEHHIARDGSTVFEYKANGVRVPSPLKSATCAGCGGTKVRIMREGWVTAVGNQVHTAPGYPATGKPAGPPPIAAAPRSLWGRLFPRRSR